MSEVDIDWMDGSEHDARNEDAYRVDTLEKAAWAMRKYRALAQRADENERLAEGERRRINLWLEDANASLIGRMEFFQQHLEAYALMLRAEGRKSVSLPDGDIKTRVTGPTFEVDKARFVEWAQEQKREDVLRVSVAPDLSAIKSTFIPDGDAAIDPVTGEIVPGLAPVAEHVSVSMVPNLEAGVLEGMDDDE